MFNNGRSRPAPSTVIPGDCRNGDFAPSSQNWVENKLDLIQRQLRLYRALTRLQPPQVSVVNPEDGNSRIVLLTAAQLFARHQAIKAELPLNADLISDRLQGSDFCVSERYHCCADRRGQVHGGMGFIFEGLDLVEGAKVAVKFFHKTDDDAATARISMELVACLRMYQRLHSACDDQNDARDLVHVTGLRDVVVDAPILNYGLASLVPSAFCATALVFDWADGGDAHSMVTTRGGITPAEGARLFWQVLRGLRALHRRGIVHRDIKPENILLANNRKTAHLCDLGFAKHVASAQPAQFMADPTTCYQSPERWSACDSPRAAQARSIGLVGGDGGGGVSRLDEAPSSLFAGDIFSAGVSLFVLVAYRAIVARHEAQSAVAVCGGAELKPPPFNVFQHAVDGKLFGLLQEGPRASGVQGRLWAYWEVYGLQLPPALRGLLDGVLHPVSAKRFTMAQAFAWMESHLEMFEDPEV